MSFQDSMLFFRIHNKNAKNISSKNLVKLISIIYKLNMIIRKNDISYDKLIITYES